MQNYTILIESRPFGVLDQTAMEKLQGRKLTLIDMRGSGVEDSDFMDAVAKSDAILCGNDLRVDDQLLASAPRCKVIAKMGAGLDTVDIAAATRHGAIVFHTPGVNNESVADHTIAMMLGLARKIVYCHQSLLDRRWEHTKIMGIELWRKTLGLVGLGAIGRSVALRAKGFDMKVVAADPYWPEAFAREQGIEQLPLDELLRVSDVVSIHSPLIPETEGLIDRQAMKKMKPTAMLINAARGGIVVESDLYEALKENEIGGAGIDVFAEEPPLESPLLELPNVLLTPHTAAFTTDAMKRMDHGIVDQLMEYLDGRMPTHTVNPEVYRQFEG
jgi:D-3-phosphoglycerate dehydrogenase / 2-oxoglutarate reductase